MSRLCDETTLLPCPWCGKRQAIHKEFGGWILNTTSHDRKCIMRKLLSFGMGGGLVFTTKAEAIAAWNTRATHGTLTAEQVREAIMSADRWEKPMGNTGLTNTHLIIRDDGWQAIADELNAELGSGTCEWLPVESCHAFAGPGWECSNCGHEVGEYEHDFYNCCPICCAKVVKR